MDLSATAEDTKVRFEISTEMNRHIEFDVGNARWRSNIEVFTVTAVYKDGWFIAHSFGPFQTDRIGVAVLIETRNEDGKTSDDRKYAFRGSLWYGQGEFIPYEELFSNHKFCFVLFFSIFFKYFFHRHQKIIC